MEDLVTASELIEILSQVPGDTPIVLSSDPEGNSYRFAYAYSTDWNFDEESRRGEIGLRVLTEKDIEEGYSEEDVMEGGTPAVVLW